MPFYAEAEGKLHTPRKNPRRDLPCTGFCSQFPGLRLPPPYRMPTIDGCRGGVPPPLIKIRAKHTATVFYSPFSIHCSRNTATDCHVGLRPPRNDKQGHLSCHCETPKGSWQSKFKIRAKHTATVPYSPFSIHCSRNTATDCHVGLRPPRNDMEGKCLHAGRRGRRPPADSIGGACTGATRSAAGRRSARRRSACRGGRPSA